MIFPETVALAFDMSKVGPAAAPLGAGGMPSLDSPPPQAATKPARRSAQKKEARLCILGSPGFKVGKTTGKQPTNIACGIGKSCRRRRPRSVAESERVFRFPRPA